MAIDPLTSQFPEVRNSLLEPERAANECHPNHCHPNQCQTALMQSIVELEQKLQYQYQCQQLVDQLTNAIRNNWDLNQIYQLVVGRLVQIMQANRGMLLLFKYADPRYRHRTTSCLPKTKATVVAEFCSDRQDAAIPAPDNSENHGFLIEPPTFSASDCGLCQPILKGQADVMLSGWSIPGFDQAADLFTLNQLPALLMVPLESQGIILGGLVLQHDCPHDWSGDEVAFGRLIAAQLSTAILQTRSFQQVQAVVQERTAQLQRSLEVQAKLYEKTRQQVEQLRKLNEEREEFLSTISHELLTPLTSMTLAIRMLRQAELDDDRRSKYLDILEKQCVQETHLINDLLALRRLDSVSANPQNAQLQKLDLCRFIQDLSQSIESDWQEKELHLILDMPARPLLLYTDSESLHRILLELLTNAYKYSDPGSTIKLKVGHANDLTTRQITLAIYNVGAGISPEDLPHIFDKFRRGHGMTKQAVRGTGLGLALVKSLVEHLDGTITATSHPLENQTAWETCFTVTFPQAADGRIHAIA